MVHTYNPGACCFVSRMENRTLQHLPSVNWTYCMTTRVDITWLLHKNVHWTLMGFTRGVPIARYEVKVKKVRFGSFLSVPVCAKDMREWEAAKSCLCFNPANWFAVSKHQTWHRLVQPLCQLMCNFVSTTVSPTHVYQKTTTTTTTLSSSCWCSESSQDAVKLYPHEHQDEWRSRTHGWPTDSQVCACGITPGLSLCNCKSCVGEKANGLCVISSWYHYLSSAAQDILFIILNNFPCVQEYKFSMRTAERKLSHWLIYFVISMCWFLPGVA